MSRGGSVPRAQVCKDSYGMTVNQILEFKNPFDLDNKFSLINLLPDRMKILYDHPNVQRYMLEGEFKLEEMLKPDTTLRRLRLNMWHLYTQVQEYTAFKGPMAKPYQFGMEKVCMGVCFPKYFYQVVLPDELSMAYMFTPPTDYEVILRESLDLGMKRMREILQFPLYAQRYSKEGNPLGAPRPDTKVADLILKTVALLDLRLNGAIPKTIHQTVHSKNVNYNVNEDIAIREELMTLENIDKKIDQIRMQTKDLLDHPEYNGFEQKFILNNAGIVTITDDEEDVISE